MTSSTPSTDPWAGARAELDNWARARSLVLPSETADGPTLLQWVLAKMTQSDGKGIEILLRRHPELVDTLLPCGRAPLTEAMLLDNTSAAQYLLQAGATFPPLDPPTPPLHMSRLLTNLVCNHSYTYAKMLLDAGIKPSHFALEQAKRANETDMVALLERYI